MEKTYKSKIGHLTIVVEISGCRRTIDFGWGVVSAGGQNGSRYRTADESLQKAIEEHKYYKQGLIWSENNKNSVVVNKSANAKNKKQE